MINLPGAQYVRITRSMPVAVDCSVHCFARLSTDMMLAVQYTRLYEEGVQVACAITMLGNARKHLCFILLHQNTALQRLNTAVLNPYQILSTYYEVDCALKKERKPHVAHLFLRWLAVLPAAQSRSRDDSHNKRSFQSPPFSGRAEIENKEMHNSENNHVQ